MVGLEPAIMAYTCVPASRKALERTGLSIEDIDRWEINEAFAGQAVACVKELGLDEDKVNVNGGAVGLGHPLAATGTRLTLTLAHELKRSGGKYGIAKQHASVEDKVSPSSLRHLICMTLLNLWSLGHFIQWSILGRFFLQNWYLFLALL